MLNQELITFGIVGATAAYSVYHLVQPIVAFPLSRWLLKQGRVKWAMKLRKKSERKSNCSNCSCR